MTSIRSLDTAGVGGSAGDGSAGEGAEDKGGTLTKAKGTTYVEHWQGRERYVNQHGEKLHARLDFRLILEDGNVKFERYREIYTCPGMP